MSGTESESTLIERLARRAKNNPVIAGLIVFATVLAFAASLLGDISSLTSLFRGQAKIIGQYHIDTENSAFAQVHPSAAPMPPGYESFKGKIFAQKPQFRLLINGVRSYASRPPEMIEANIWNFWTLFDPDPIVGQRGFDLALNARIILEQIKEDFHQSSLPSDRLAPFFAQPAQVVPIVGYAAEVLAFLEPLYMNLRDPPLKASTVASLVSTTEDLWPKSEDLPQGDPHRTANKIFRHAALRQVYPVITLVISNEGSSSQVVTGLAVEVKEFYALADTYVSGPLELLDSVTIDLNGQPGTFFEDFSEPKKIAPKDAVQFKVRLTSSDKGAYIANIRLMNGENQVYSTDDFVVIFDVG